MFYSNIFGSRKHENNSDFGEIMELLGNDFLDVETGYKLR